VKAEVDCEEEEEGRARPPPPMEGDRRRPMDGAKQAIANECLSYRSLSLQISNVVGEKTDKRAHAKSQLSRISCRKLRVSFVQNTAFSKPFPE